MKSTFRWLLVFCCLFGSLAVADDSNTLTPTANSSSIDSQSLQQQLTLVEHTYQRLLKDLEQNILPATAKQLLGQLALQRQQIARQAVAIAAEKTAQIEAKLRLSDHLVAQIKKSKQLVQQSLALLKHNDKQLSADLAYLKSRQQLIKNPVNRARVSDVIVAQMSDLIGRQKQLKKQYQTQIDRQQQALSTFHQDNEQLQRWSSVLSEALINSNHHIDAKDERQRLIALAQSHESKASEVENKLNHELANLTIGDIEQRQNTVFKHRTLAWLSKVDSQLVDILTDNKLPTAIADLSIKDVRQLIQYWVRLNTATKHLDELQAQVDNRLAALHKRYQLLKEDNILLDEVKRRQKSIAYQRLQIQDQMKYLLQVMEKKNREATFTQDKFYQSISWRQFVKTIPKSWLLITYQINISFQALWQSLIIAPVKTIAIVMVLLLSLLGGRFLLFQSLPYSVHKRRNAWLGCGQLILIWRHYIWFTMLCLVLALLVCFVDISDPGDHIILAILVAFWAIFLWQGLLRNEVKRNRFPRPLFKPMLISAVMLVLSASSWALAYMSLADSFVVIFYEKITLILLLIFVWLMRKVIPYYVGGINDSKFSNRLYKLLLLLRVVSWVVMMACLLGIIGYGALAWLVLMHLGIQLFYLAVFIVGTLFINNVRKVLKLWALKRFKHGAFVAQDIISPLSSVVKITWFAALVLGSLLTIGWTSDSYIIAKIIGLLRYPIVQFGGNPPTTITLLNMILSILAVYLILRVTKWLKTFSYHWLFARVDDLGVRNSLSIFSQYAAALIGFLMALNIIGINLTSLAVFAGALGVGIGLGLQDIAKNFISGILILVERPLRSGDWVSIDANEGVVKSIGMRSIIIETFDHQEVIIPNGNVINNSFVNYTRSNQVTRTVLYIGVAYKAQPEQVIALLHDCLDKAQAVLAEPKANVILWEYADSAVIYRLQYYINVAKDSLLNTRTEILKTIWHTLKENAIDIPYPQMDVHLTQVKQANVAISE